MDRLKASIRQNVAAGLLIVAPVCLTYLLLVFTVTSFDDVLLPGIVWILRKSGADVPEDFNLPGLGFAAAFLSIFLIGLLAANFLGKKLVDGGESILRKIPFIRSIYISVKKLVETVSQTSTPAFKQVVLLDYPRPGMRALGIISGEVAGEISHRIGGGELVNVFVSTTPNPTTGYLIVVPKSQVVPMTMSVDSGVKMIISTGMFNAESAEKGRVGKAVELPTPL